MFENFKELVTENEIAMHDPADVWKCAEMLVRNGYVVMVSREEDMWIINYVWTENYSDRGEVVFNQREVLMEY